MKTSYMSFFLFLHSQKNKKMKSTDKLSQARNIKRRADLVKLLFYKNEKFNFLTDRENEVMRMVHWEEFNLEQISQKLNISKSRLSLILKNAEKKFRNHIFRSLNCYNDYTNEYFSKNRLIDKLQTENRVLKELINKNISNIDNKKINMLSVYDLDVMGLNIVDSGLSVRALNAIRSNFDNIQTISDLFEIKENDLMKSRHLGVKTMNEIFNLFHNNGIDFKNKKLVNSKY